jgi:hypothetical protein
LIVGIAALSIWWRFDRDIKLASARVAHGSTLIATRCGPIEYQEAGTGIPLLAVHGGGGGYDQGMAFAGALAHRGIRVIAMSRFGYAPLQARRSACCGAGRGAAEPNAIRRRRFCRPLRRQYSPASRAWNSEGENVPPPGS